CRALVRRAAADVPDHVHRAGRALGGGVMGVRKRQPWDFALMVITVVLLAGLGLQSFVGTLYSWWAYRTQPAWELTGHAGFVATMNVIAAPMLLGLVVVMGLCVPKR